MPSVILYSTSSGTPGATSIQIKGSPGVQPIFVRAEFHPGDIDAALNDASPSEGEVVLNTVKHPE